MPRTKSTRPFPVLSIFLIVMAGITGCDWRSANPPAAPRPKLRVAIASSLRDVVGELRKALSRDLGADIDVIDGASSTLARQIESGLEADVYVSASLEWVDYLDQKKLLLPQSRVNIAGNRLVVVMQSTASARPSRLEDLGLPSFHPLALGDPSHVPVGRYARQALEASGVWNSVKDHVTSAPDARAALALVVKGQCPAGIVYQTDVTRRLDVSAAFAIDPRLHEPIIYAGAVVNGTKYPELSQKALNWLTGPQATVVFRREGFLPLP
ncbi:MAG: molybdate ABC transporter substrate-binding protein [Planctomycetes bacterium]|nr:molybdate ABC transporter substrate-binding protein [Planctomycetota bacterium]